MIIKDEKYEELIYGYPLDGPYDFSLYRHKLRGNYSFVKNTKCGMNMVVLDHFFEGIDVNDNRIETIGIRGL